MQTNCIVTDNGYSFSLDSKNIQAPNGERIVGLYDIDITKLTEYELIQLTILFSQAYEEGKKSAEHSFKKKINSLFGFSIDK